MINLKSVVCFLCCLLIFSGNVISTTYKCSSCSGGSGWSGGSGSSTPPGCDDYVSTRTLGSCSRTGNEGDECYTSSRPTKHIKTYIYFPDEECETSCRLWATACAAYCLIAVCEDNYCMDAMNMCLDGCEGSCVLLDDTYTNNKTGC